MSEILDTLTRLSGMMRGTVTGSKSQSRGMEKTRSCGRRTGDEKKDQSQTKEGGRGGRGVWACCVLLAVRQMLLMLWGRRSRGRRSFSSECLKQGGRGALARATSVLRSKRADRSVGGMLRCRE